MTAPKQDMDKRRDKNSLTVLSETDVILVKKSENFS